MSILYGYMVTASLLSFYGKYKKVLDLRILFLFKFCSSITYLFIAGYDVAVCRRIVWVFDHFLVLVLKEARCLLQKRIYSLGIYLLKVNNRNTSTRCEICSKLTLLSLLLTCCSGVFIVNFEHVSHHVLVFQFFCENVNL